MRKGGRTFASLRRYGDDTQSASYLSPFSVRVSELIVVLLKSVVDSNGHFEQRVTAYLLPISAKMTEPSPKRIKTKGNLPVPVKSEAAAAPVKSEPGVEGSDFPVTVMFNFRSSKTSFLKEGQMTGTLHVPMLQDPLTGRFRIPAGTTKAKGNATFDYIRFHNGQYPRNFWTGKILSPRPLKAPTRNLRSRASSWVTVSLGNRKIVGSHPYLINPVDGEVDTDGYPPSEFLTYPEDSDGTIDRNLYRKRLNEWETSAGGMLTVFAKGKVDDSFLEYVDEQEL